MILVPLGVSSATPTAQRHLPSMALWRDGQVFLFDCGENTQMQMLKVGMKRSKIDYIFITHLDGDHYFGLPGLISTMHIQRRERDLTIVGPVGIKEYLDFQIKFSGLELTYDIHYVELEEGFEGGTVIDEDEFTVESKPMIHNKFCLGYRLQEKDKPGKVDADKAKGMGISQDEEFKALKAGDNVTLDDGTVVKSDDIVGPNRTGKSLAYITDTRPCANAVELASDSDILVYEATFGNKLKDKAEETRHSTADEAAKVAKAARAKLLVLTHFSARYTNEFLLYKEAKEVFDNTWIANELRAIYTDPKTEGGMFKPVSFKSKDDFKKGGRSSSKDRPDNKKSGGSFKKRRMRPRKGGSGSSSSSSSGGSRSSGGSSFSKRPTGKSSYYKSDSDDRRRSSSSSKSDRNDRSEKRDYDSTRGKKVDNDSKPEIKPRNNFDDYDQF